MAGKQKEAAGYERLKEAIANKDNSFGNLYIFHGEERYLLERSLEAVRKQLCPGGTDGFNYRRYEGGALSIAELDDAVNTLPVFAERTLVEIYDYEIFAKGRGSGEDENEYSAEGDGESRGEGSTEGNSADGEPEGAGAGEYSGTASAEALSIGYGDSRGAADIAAGAKKSGGKSKTAAGSDKSELLELFSNLPDYVCVIFIYDTLAFKPDRRRRINADLLGKAEVVEFAVQEIQKLRKWISDHFRDAGKHISSRDAEYIAFITGGDMSTLLGEIEKVAAYSAGETVTRADIDAVTTPVLDAVAYKMTDALVAGNAAAAMRILDELLRMREVPHKILYSISLKMRQLLAARVWAERGLDRAEFLDVCGIRHDFQAAPLLGTARKMSLLQCRSAVQACSESAYLLNSGSDAEACLIELVAKLALLRK